jgi:hypothetical protein
MKGIFGNFVLAISAVISMLYGAALPLCVIYLAAGPDYFQKMEKLTVGNICLMVAILGSMLLCFITWYLTAQPVIIHRLKLKRTFLLIGDGPGREFRIMKWHAENLEGYLSQLRRRSINVNRLIRGKKPID